MRKEKGSVLAITTSFVLAFTMLGFAAIYFSGVQSQEAERKVASAKAFWLAEAGVERAFARMPEILFNACDALGEGSYCVSTQNYTYANNTNSTNRWNITSTGFVTPVNRTIYAEVGANVWRAITTTGTLSGPGAGGLDDQIDPDGSYEENANFTFEGIFNISQTTMFNMRTSYPPADINPSTPDGIIWVQPGDVKITNAWGDHAGIMVVNGNLTMEGGLFTGIIWVNGGCKMVNGNDVTDGAVFVNDTLNGETKITGTSTLTFSREAIDNAFSLINTNSPSSVHNIVFWQEVN